MSVPGLITLATDLVSATMKPLLHSLAAVAFAGASEEIIRQFAALDRSTAWNLVEKIEFEGPTWEPEGIVRLGADRYFVSAGECLHLQGGDLEYHNGGLDYDGTYLWATLSEYRPNSTATLVRLRPSTLEPEPILRVRDHQGGIVHDLSTGELTTLNWGSRRASQWSLRYPVEPVPDFTTPLATTRNPSGWIDYQDCKFLGRSKALDSRAVMACGGIADIGGGDGQQAKVTIGGIALVDVLTMTPLIQVPIPMVTEQGAHMAKNPFDLALVDGKLRLYFLPDEEHSTLYVYEAR
ncbi:unnamed protein product [Parascedosporium putredinis]|uniref:Uncharacterized protein n=1 Tax=Parascedosporium putredinis TaxID=1442378 RepID=A0A9P1MAB7_9PEZI|nr:unnamed protein product [Parascedosporium putredinis]CAI7992472.1 unnamed protein product [Parascedosporium putredinis]